MIKEYIKSKVLICDGAMGTYYSEISGNDISYCEFGNLNDKETIKKIHTDYINAGAKLIRTNTFSANTRDLGVNLNVVRQIIDNGINIAKEAVGNSNVFIGASIGPIRSEDYDENLKEYKFIVDCFLKQDINIFIFETLSNTSYLKEISEYIKCRDKEAFILTQFAIKPDGFSRDGISIQKIISEVKRINNIDSYGFNCGSGPAHLSDMVKKINIEDDIVSVLPNAGFPEIIHERTLYPNNPKYFARRVSELRKYGVSIIGGCCGTNPTYIKNICEYIKKDLNVDTKLSKITCRDEYQSCELKNNFKNKLANNQFTIAVELTAPIDTNTDKLIESARICKQNNIDLVTIPDSPMSKVRADSAIIAAKVKREIGIEAMPHICCRDKNINAIRSCIIGSHIENIRNVLAITGDPISDANNIETKSVFNLNSFRLINLIDNMNDEIFKTDKIFIGGALNLNVKNKNIEYERMMKKIDNGAKFFLTQPIYDEEALEFLKEIKNKTDVKILGGILPIVSYRNAVFLNNELPGVTIPDNLLKQFNENMSKDEGEKVGVEIASSMGKKLKAICDGLYFIVPFNRVNMIVNIINKINS